MDGQDERPDSQGPAMAPKIAEIGLLEATFAHTASNGLFPGRLGPWEYAGSIQHMRKTYPNHHLHVLRRPPQKVGF